MEARLCRGERGGSMVECRTPEREVRGSRPTAAVLCPWARHFTPRKYWLITQEAMAPSRHDWKIVDWDVKPQHNQPTNVFVETPWYSRDVNPVNHFLPEKCVTRPSSFNWLWWGSQQKSAKGRNFPFSCLCKIYINAINGILAFCSYVIMDSQTPIFGWYCSSKTYIHAIWIKKF